MMTEAKLFLQLIGHLYSQYQIILLFIEKYYFPWTHELVLKTYTSIKIEKTLQFSTKERCNVWDDV